MEMRCWHYQILELERGLSLARRKGPKAGHSDVILATSYRTLKKSKAEGSEPSSQGRRLLLLSHVSRVQLCATP